MRSNGIATINKMMKIKNMKNNTLIEYINYKRKTTYWRFCSSRRSVTDSRM